MKFTKYESKTAVYVNSKDIEDFIQKIYCQSLNIARCAIKNRSRNFQFEVKKEELGPYQMEMLEHFKQHGGCNIILPYILINDMCNMGIVPDGEWYITIQW